MYTGDPWASFMVDQWGRAQTGNYGVDGSSKEKHDRHGSKEMREEREPGILGLNDG
jgi:hypothetical protein